MRKTIRKIDELKGKFDAFVARGVKGELSRSYISINERYLRFKNELADQKLKL